MPKFLDTPQWYNEDGDLIGGQWCGVYTSYSFAANANGYVATILPPIEGITYGQVGSSGGSSLLNFLKNNNFMGTESSGPVNDQGLWIASGRIAISSTEYAYVFGLFVPTTALNELWAMTSQGPKMVVIGGTWVYSKITW